MTPEQTVCEVITHFVDVDDLQEVRVDALAAAIAKALGLRQEWTWSWPNGSGMGTPGYGFSVDSHQEAIAESDRRTYDVVTRYVTERSAE